MAVTHPQSHRALTDLVSTPQTRIRYSAGRGGHLVIAFASIGRRRSEMPPDEFLGTLLGQQDQHCIFVSDRGRSWMNDATHASAVQDAVNAIRKSAGITHITTLGVSLGAFSALVAADLFPVKAAIAISPQFSISKQVMPLERRWGYWRKRIPDFRYETAEVSKRADREFLFHGLKDDLEHMHAFEKRHNRDHFVFPDAGHAELGGRFKDRAVLSELVRACAIHDRRRVAQLAARCGGLWRARFEKARPRSA